jgi:hypothetical protein
MRLGSVAHGEDPAAERAQARLHHENAERPTIANYTLAVLSAIFTFGEVRGLIAEGMKSDAPCRAI